LSRAARPKFLLPLTGTSESLLRATVDRVGLLAGPESTLVVTGAAHAAAVARELPELPHENVVVEPAPLDSCAAIGLAAALIARRDPDAVMGSFAADHLVGDRRMFADVVTMAIGGARRGYLMTVGITPTRAETGYGYLRIGDEVLPGLQRVVEFTEKPDLNRATSYVASGHHLWNASMFVWQVGVFLDELRSRQPAMHAGLMAIAGAWDRPDRDLVLGAVWPRLPRISVDYAVMESAAVAGRVGVVAGAFGWHDVGDHATVGDLLGERDGESNLVVNDSKEAFGEAPVLLASTGDTVVIPRSGRLIAVQGVSGLIIVDTDDALLICRRDRAQDVKEVVDRLRAKGIEQLT
jgi:mannose-1-phosphate guanylyltransferase